MTSKRVKFVLVVGTVLGFFVLVMRKTADASRSQEKALHVCSYLDQEEEDHCTTNREDHCTTNREDHCKQKRSARNMSRLLRTLVVPSGALIPLMHLQLSPCLSEKDTFDTQGFPSHCTNPVKEQAPWPHPLPLAAVGMRRKKLLHYGGGCLQGSDES